MKIFSFLGVLLKIIPRPITKDVIKNTWNATAIIGVINAFKYVEKEFEDADIVHGNIEAVLSQIPKSRNIDDLSLIADERSIESLKKIHLNIANVANNHNLDHGFDKFKKSCPWRSSSCDIEFLYS